MLAKIRKGLEGDDIRLGAVRDKLVQLGYNAPVSALMPFGVPMGVTPTWRMMLPDYSVSEHPGALFCASRAAPLALLLVEAIDDPELAMRAAAILAAYTTAPCRVGSDGTRLHVLRASAPFTSSGALSGRVQFLHERTDGPIREIVPELLPLDGTWERSLLDTRYSDLPSISPIAVNELVAALEAIPYQLAEERRPPPKPSRSAFLGWSGR